MLRLYRSERNLSMAFDKKAYHKEYMKEWYKKNKAKHIEYNNNSKRARKDRFQEFKATLSCARCGFSHPAVLDFHHLDPTKKASILSKMVNDGLAWKTIMAEVAKCEVLCANCHRIEHYQDRRTRYSSEGSAV